MMVSTTAGGRPLKSAASRPGATHGGSIDLDVGAIWCQAPERGGPFSEECAREVLNLRVPRIRAASSTSWTTWGLAGTRGAPLSCERLDAPAYVSIRPGAEQLWRTQEGGHGDGQTEAWPRGQRWMVHHAGAGCAGSPRSAAVQPRTAGRSPRRCRWTALPGRWGRRESVLCRRPSSLPGWARDGAPGPPWWTSPSRGTAPWLSSLVERSQSPCAAPALTPGRYYPRAPVWAPWLGEPTG